MRIRNTRIRVYAIRVYAIRVYAIRVYAIREYAIREYAIREYGIAYTESRIPNRVHGSVQRQLAEGNTVPLISLLPYIRN